MKSQLRKLKGGSLKTEIGNIVLLQPFREEETQEDEIYFTINIENGSVKIIDLQTQECQNRFIQEKNIYQSNTLNILPKCTAVGQVSIKNKNYGYLVFHNLSKDKMLGSLANNRQLIGNFLKTFFQCLQQLKQFNNVILNIVPENIYLSTSSELILIEPVYLTNRAMRSALEIHNEDLFEKIDHQYKYFSPELLDNFTNHIIDYRSDLFVIGCILSELITGRYPFQNKTAVLSNDISENLNQLGQVGKIIKCMIQPYNKRSQPQELLKMLHSLNLQSNFGLDKFQEENDQQINTSGQLKSDPHIVSPNSKMSLFDDIKFVFNKYTKETEGWYLNYAENDSLEPPEKYLDLMLKKIYSKNNKIEKLCLLIKKHTIFNGPSAPFFLIKSLILIGNLLRKGPWEVFEIAEEWKQILNEIMGLCTSTGLQLIVQVCKMLKNKIDLNLKIGKILYGNFHLEDLSKFKQLKLQNLYQMSDYLKNMVGSLQVIVALKKQELIQYVINFYCDQIYDLLSMLILSVISLRKDNQLKLRQDQTKKVEPLQKNLNNILKKVSRLSNYVNAHAIYSVEVDYSYYQEEIQLKQNPYYSSLQHFYRSNRIYKGLQIPTNYAQYYLPNKTYGSGDCNTSTSKGNYFQNDNLEQQNVKQKNIDKQEEKVFNNTIQQDKKNLQSFQFFFQKQIPKNKTVQKIIFGKQQKIPKPKVQRPNVNFFQQKQVNNNPQNDLFSQFINIIQEPIQNIPKKSQKNIFQQFKFDKIGEVPKDLNRPTKSGNQQKKIINNNSMKKSNIITSNNSHIKQQSVYSVEKQANLFEDFDKLVLTDIKIQTKKQIKKTPPIQKSKKEQINQMFNVNWLKESKSLTPKIPLGQVQSAYYKQIVENLRLSELKDLIRKNSHLIVKFNELKLDKIIGSGSAGEVFLGTYKDQTIAIKKVKTLENPNALKEFERQLVTYIKIKKHPNLVSLVGVSKLEGDFYLLTQFCNSGSLFDLLHKKINTISLSWKQRVEMVVGIAKGMHILHSMKPVIIHRDLKSLNVFVNEQNGKFVVKVADFGLSRSPEAEMMTSALGTLHWMAPQLLENKQYSLKVDVYSFGILLWEICSRKTPYHNLTSPMAILKYVTFQKKRPGLEFISPDCPAALVMLMQKCWAHQPSERPGFDQIIESLAL